MDDKKVGKLAASGTPGTKGNRKGIKHSHQGRMLHDTEHHDRMKHELGADGAYPAGEESCY